MILRKKLTITIFLVLPFFIGLYGQNPFRIKVIDAKYRDNIPGVIVYVEELAIQEKETDENGLVFYKNLPADRKVKIVARKLGYQSQSVDVLANPNALPDNNITLELNREELSNVVIWGEITDNSGNDVNNAMIEINLLGNIYKAFSDQSGNYKIELKANILKNVPNFRVEVSAGQCEKLKIIEMYNNDFYLNCNYKIPCGNEVERSQIRGTKKIDLMNLVGTWACQSFENGRNIVIKMTLQPDRIVKYRFYNQNGLMVSLGSGQWKYIDGKLFETIDNSSIQKSSISELTWKNNDEFTQKILDNDIEAYKGFERNFLRVK